jgi:hypothetical protein
MKQGHKLLLVVMTQSISPQAGSTMASCAADADWGYKPGMTANLSELF